MKTIERKKNYSDHAQNLLILWEIKTFLLSQ